MKKFYLFISAIFCVFLSYAQAPDFSMSESFISGKIVDSLSKKGIEYATITLFKTKDSTVANGGITAKDGSFRITGLKPDMYYARIDFVGYKRKFISNIKLTPPTQMQRELGVILLSSSQKNLKEVQITGEKAFQSNQADKKVFTADKLISSTSGSASDLLNNLPSVSMSSDNKLEMRGNDKLNILINGKPSSMTESSLSQIPASAIESVEIITNPSAKFDPEGTAGIINIILKKGKANQNYGSATIGYGSWDKVNANAMYMMSREKMNFSASYGFRYDTRRVWGWVDRNFINSDDTWTHFLQNTSGLNISRSHFARVTTEFFPTPKNTISLSGSYNYGLSTNRNTKTNDNINLLDTIQDSWNRYTKEGNTNHSFDASLGWKREFSGMRHYLNIEATQNSNYNDVDNLFYQPFYTLDYTPVFITSNQSIYNKQRRNTSVFQVDYAQPFRDKMYLETGSRMQIRLFNFLTDTKNLDANSGEYNEDTTQSNNFYYNDYIAAAYGTFSASMGKASVKAGLRLEQTWLEYKNKSGDAYISQNYFSYFPSIALSRELSKNKSITITYTKRINRPSPGMLNPLQDNTDPQNLRYGNPTLKPEYIHSVEIGYSYTNKKYSFNSAIYYKSSNNAITRYVTVDSLGRSLVKIDNLGYSKDMGWESSVNTNPTKWFNALLSSNLIANSLEYKADSKTYTRSTVYWIGRLMTNFKLPKEIDIQLTGFLRTNSKTPQGTFIGAPSLEVNLRKKILKQKGLITIGVSDVFNTSGFRIKASDENFNVYAVRRHETRVLNLAFKYNFGTETKKAKTVNKRDEQPRNADMQEGY